MSRAPARFTQADVARAIESGQTFIYFLRAGEFVKIGQSRRWKIRMEQMRVGSPYTIVPLLVLIGDPDLERKLHTRFKASRFRGEWFRVGGAINTFIKENLHACVAKLEIDDLRQPEEPEEEIVL